MGSTTFYRRTNRSFKGGKVVIIIKLYRSLLVMALMALMILGLNISNKGINSLTMETRNPVVAFQTQGNNVIVYTMGKTYFYDKQDFIRDITLTANRIKSYTLAANDYLLRILRIIRVLLFA